MKSSLAIVLIFIAASVFAQAPDYFKYQAIVRKSNGHLVTEEAVNVRVSVRLGATDGDVVYQEVHNTESSPNGIVNLNIGAGSTLSGDFSAIDWSADSYFLQVEMDLDSENVFQDMGTAQLLAVPYALYAKRSGGQQWQENGPDIYRAEGKVGIGTDAPVESLHINGNIRGNQQGGALRVNTDYGYLDIGAKNADYAHFYTNMPYGFYFGGSVTVRDHLIGYRESDLHLSTQSQFNFQPVKRVTILNSNGYVGIGTTTPQYNLDVNGTINASEILINGEPIATGGSSGEWSKSGNNLYYTTGYIGIGTASPQEALHINGNIRGNQSGGAVRINTTYGYLDVGPKNADYAHFYTNMPYGFYFGGNVTVRENLIGYREYDLSLSTQSQENYQPVKRMTILNANGNVGIGTTSPQSKLQIEEGDVYIKNAASGVIMKSPNNQCWRLTVGNDGAPVFTSVACPD